MKDIRNIDTRTLEGLKRAERLTAQGWKAVSIGFTVITFERENTKTRK